MSIARVNVPALVALWARGVEELQRAATDRIHAPTGDLAEQVAVRHEIAQRLRERPASAETRDLLAEFDEVFRSLTTECASCLHGDERAASQGWTRGREWYFWRAPATQRT